MLVPQGLQSPVKPCEWKYIGFQVLEDQCYFLEQDFNLESLFGRYNRFAGFAEKKKTYIKLRSSTPCECHILILL